MRASGLTVMPAYPFGCECGESGCRVTWTATPDDYAARTASERLLTAHDIPKQHQHLPEYMIRQGPNGPDPVRHGRFIQLSFAS
jgi:hypothetical protein